MFMDVYAHKQRSKQQRDAMLTVTQMQTDVQPSPALVTLCFSPSIHADFLFCHNDLIHQKTLFFQMKQMLFVCVIC